MRKLLTCYLYCFVWHSATAQEPYLATAGGDGLGQYGYLEKDATTFARLERNSYNNIDFLSARWWVTDNDPANGNGREYVYHVYNGPDWIAGTGWQCGGDNYPSKRTTDFTATDFSPEWGAGTDCYVSVCAKYCDNSFYPTGFDGLSTNGAIGFNERHFKVLDIDSVAHASTASMIANSGGNCVTNNSNNVAGSFSADPGAVTGLNITGLMLFNSGSAQEGTAIPNSAFHVYYEPATGSELYGDGNEIYAGTLQGDWDGNTGDNIYGSKALNISLTGKTRIYILLCEYAVPIAESRLINLGIINDGIFLSPAVDVFTKMRINATGISQRNIVLPLRFTAVAGLRENDVVRLKWKITPDHKPTLFVVEESLNGSLFNAIASPTPGSLIMQNGFYHYSLQSKAPLFRIVATNQDGSTIYSPIISIKPDISNTFQLLETGNSNEISIRYGSNAAGIFQARLLDLTGRCLLQKTINFRQGVQNIYLPFAPAARLLILQLVDYSGEMVQFRIIH